MIDNIELISQSALRIIYNDKVIYFDPFNLDNKYNNDADYIFITHPHYDHFSERDLSTIMNKNTKIIVPIELEQKCESLGFEYIITVEQNKKYIIDDINFETTPAYNINKDFHKKEYNWVGYIINLNNERIYVSGDTDIVKELYDIKCDIACVCIGGYYTCDYKEASSLIKMIKPNYAIPTHYKTVVGSLDDACNFKSELDDVCEVRILMK